MSTISSAKKRKIGRPSVDSEAVNVRLERAMLSNLDDWRRSQRDLPTRPEAMRRLIELGLAASENLGGLLTAAELSAPQMKSVQGDRLRAALKTIREAKEVAE